MEQQKIDILVFSDGSGYKDGYGGWAALACTPDRRWKTFRMGALVGTTVDRAEMTGMLEGLEMAFWLARDMPEFSPTAGTPNRKPVVLVHTDRENMVLSIKGVYDRSNCPDLWRRFEHYEQLLEIHVQHVEREVDFAEFQLCDLHASTGREIAKNYALNCAMPAWTLNF